MILFDISDLYGIVYVSMNLTVYERTYYMKKGTVAGIAFAILGIIALCALAGYLTWQCRDQLLPSMNQKTESEAEAAISALQETAAEEDTEAMTDAQTAQEVESLSYLNSELSGPVPSVIWVGDSRTLGMQKAVANSDVYIGAAGEGYDWFIENGLDEMRSAIRENPESVIVFNFGVNDYDNMENYLELYQTLFEEYPDRHFYFLAVNPIDPELCENITNEEIADFNDHLRRLSPDSFIDSYTQIKSAEIQTIDGIHYSQDDYRFIYDYAIRQIAAKEQ